jgi:hypothetical protein
MDLPVSRRSDGHPAKTAHLTGLVSTFMRARQDLSRKWIVCRGWPAALIAARV